MKIRYSINPKDFKSYGTEKMRDELLMQALFEDDQVNFTYTYEDRVIFGGITPVSKDLTIDSEAEYLHSAYFLEGREMGVINVGGAGIVEIDGVEYTLNYEDGCYIPKGVKNVVFKSGNTGEKTKFYVASAPAHQTYEFALIEHSKAQPRELGEQEKMNKRTIFQYVHPDVCDSCQLVMGLTKLDSGNGWNTMPAHTHERRMEVYFYYNMSDATKVMHFLGEPTETRHIVMGNEEATISPSWSIHSGIGYGNYSFIWAMAGENKTFDDMDFIDLETLK